LCKDRARLALLVVVLANQKRPCIAVALPFSGDEDKIGGSAIFRRVPMVALADLALRHLMKVLKDELAY